MSCKMIGDQCESTGKSLLKLVSPAARRWSERACVLHRIRRELRDGVRAADAHKLFDVPLPMNNPRREHIARAHNEIPRTLDASVPVGRLKALEPRREALVKSGAGLILSWHGVLTAGKDLANAYDTLERLEWSAHTMLMQRLLHIGAESAGGL